MDKKFGFSTKELVGCVAQLLRKYDRGTLPNFQIVEINPDLRKVVFVTRADLGEPAKEPWSIHRAPNPTCKRPWTIMQPGQKPFWAK